MRIEDAPFLRDLSPSQRRQIVNEAVREQGQQIDRLVNDLFTQSAAAAEEAVRPLSYWSSLARENARSPAATPLEFWANLEQQRRRQAEIDQGRSLASLFGVDRLRPGGPLKTAGVEPAPAAGLSTRLGPPPIGLPTPAPIRTLSYEDIVRVRSETVGLIGRLIDVFA